MATFGGGGSGGWKTRITSTLKTNSKMNALLNDSLNLMSLVKKKNLIKLKDKLGNNNDDKELVRLNSIKHLKFDDPFNTLKISSEKLFGILVETINDQLNDDTYFHTYNSQISSKFCQILSREINSNIKMLQYQRSKHLSEQTAELCIDSPCQKEFLKKISNNCSADKILGRGSYGTVFKAFYKEKPVAVKIIKNIHDINFDSVSRESHIVGWNHKNIIQIIKIKIELNISIIIMERFSGLCLQHLIDQQRISLMHCYRIILDISEALKYCHNNHLIHLDVKPKNILIGFIEPNYSRKISNSTKYFCKLCDFGCSMYNPHHRNQNNITTSGTIRYMSPQILQGLRPTPKDDIYSLGITMWQIYVNQYPYNLITSNDIVAYRVVKDCIRPNMFKVANNDTLIYEKIYNATENGKVSVKLCEYFTSNTNNNNSNYTQSQRNVMDNKIAKTAVNISSFNSTDFINNKIFYNKNINLKSLSTNGEYRQGEMKRKKLNFNTSSLLLPNSYQKFNLSPTKTQNCLIHKLVETCETKKCVEQIFLYKYKELYKRCWNTNRIKRPPANELVQIISDILK